MKSIPILILLFSFVSSYGQALEQNLSSFYDHAVTADGLVRYDELDGRLLNTIVNQIGSFELSNAESNEKTAFYINAYNISVIAGVLHRYDELKSVQEDGNFFKSPHLIAGENIGLDDLEKRILKLYPSGDIHLVLNCGAIGCPPLRKTVYQGSILKEQLKETVTANLASDKVLNDGKLSAIFQWYATDFTPNVKSFVTKHGGPKLTTLKYMDYDWSLNTSSPQFGNEAKQTRYYSSNLYGKGAFEVGVFNNYYQQKNSVSNWQEDYFTSTITAIFGINKRINVGLDLRIRGVQSGLSSALSSFGALSYPSEKFQTDIEGNTIKSTRSGLTAIGLKLKYQPWQKIKNLTFQHTLYIPTIDSRNEFLDWESPYLLSDAYYDKNLSNNTALFVSGGLHFENINSTLLGSGSGYSQVSTPFTAIYSYFPTKKATIYGLINVAPKWGVSRSTDNESSNISWDPFGQLGFGTKYFLTDKLQVELLFTGFFDNTENRSANTYNLGIRYYSW